MPLLLLKDVAGVRLGRCRPRLRVHPRKVLRRWTRGCRTRRALRPIHRQCVVELRPGCHGPPGRDRHPMSVDAHLSREEEDRLAELWKQRVDAEHGEPSEVWITALFSAPDAGAPRNVPPDRAGAQGPEADQGPSQVRRRRLRQRLAGRPVAGRSLVACGALFVALVLTSTALRESPRTTRAAGVAGPPAPVLAAVPRGAGPSVGVAPRHAKPARRHGQRREGRARRVQVRHERLHAARRAQLVSRHAPRPARSAPRHSGPAALPQMAPAHRVASAPASSACDEFPPC